MDSGTCVDAEQPIHVSESLWDQVSCALTVKQCSPTPPAHRKVEARARLCIDNSLLASHRHVSLHTWCARILVLVGITGSKCRLDGERGHMGLPMEGASSH